MKKYTDFVQVTVRTLINHQLGHTLQLSVQNAFNDIAVVLCTSRSPPKPHTVYEINNDY